MTDLRQAAQQALEALEELDGLDTETECVTIDVGDVMDALTAALEQQAEPVHGDIRALKYRIHELEGEVIGYKRMLDVAEAASQPQQQAEPVSHAVIVGALFDFMGWLTTRKERLILSSTDNASPAADAIKVFAEMRGLSLDDALVQDWQNYTTPPQQQAEPVAWDKPSASFNGWWDSYHHDPANPFTEGLAAYWAWAGWKAAQRQWVGLTKVQQDDFADAYGSYEAVCAIEAKLKEKNT